MRGDMDAKKNARMSGQLGNLGGARKAGSLGRGLGALIPPKANKRDFFECPVHRIRRAPDQPRRFFDQRALEELAESIRNNGLIQPLVVRQDGSHYRLIAGERRWRAAQLAGLEQVPVVIKDVAHDAAFELALIENIQRQDLNPVEEAEAYQRLLNLRNYTQEEMAKQVGKSRSAVANSMRLLNLSEKVQQLIAEGKLSGGAARALLSISDKGEQDEVAFAAVENKFSVRQLEAVTRYLKAGDSVALALEKVLNPDEVDPEAFAVPEEEPEPEEEETEEVAEEAPEKETVPPEVKAKHKAWASNIGESLGIKANIKARGNGESGTIELAFADEATLQRLLGLLLKEGLS